MPERLLLREAIRSTDMWLQGGFVGPVPVEYHGHPCPDQTRLLFEADYTINEEIIRALGEIGDSRAVPELGKMARSGRTLHPQRQMKMKEVLFESLERYPPDAIAGLIRVGELVNNDAIRRSCKKLMERK
jgi:hypothetical protein